MSGRFYAAWAAAVIAALVLPIAIPFALWPPREGPHAGLVAECGRRAELDAARETPFVWFPLSSDVQFCERDSAGALIYRVEVTARGPYGIPYASGFATNRDIQHLHENGGVALGLAALLASAVAVSLPFLLLSLRRTMRLALAS